MIDDRQITHLIAVRLEYFLYDFWGVFPPSSCFFLYKRPKALPGKRWTKWVHFLLGRTVFLKGRCPFKPQESLFKL